ncbi:unnamed protein product [Rodentolepis nana]|uniref:CNH domain-containing protein n=1 Tax=Rodentolepis nana TaxID=102285 RepID=A0A0R3TB47_RODNA|nr:unnamed protein product [Rodentolepis nana]
MHPYEVNTLALRHHSAYLPLNDRHANIHKVPYKLIQNKSACFFENVPRVLGYTEDSVEALFFCNTENNKIVQGRVHWIKSDERVNIFRGYASFRTIYDSIPRDITNERIKFCKTSEELLLLASDKLQVLTYNDCSKLAQEPSQATIGCFWPHTPHNLAYLLHDEKVVLSVKNEGGVKVELSQQQLTNLPNVTLGHGRGGKTRFDALASASSYDRGDRLLAYLAVREKFSLLNFSSRELELISFGDTTGQSHRSKILYAQCLLREDNERWAVIVQRRDRSIEMWDDRQPRCPFLSFKSTSLTRPAIELPLQSMLALHQDPNKSVKLYSLRTGDQVSTVGEQLRVGEFSMASVEIFEHSEYEASFLATALVARSSRKTKFHLNVQRVELPPPPPPPESASSSKS